MFHNKRKCDLGPYGEIIFYFYGYLKRGTMENESNTNQYNRVQGLQVDVRRLERQDSQFYDDLPTKMGFNHKLGDIS